MTLRAFSPLSLSIGSLTRASTATYFDKTGTIQSAAINTLRVGYNPATLNVIGILFEPNAATNLLLNSLLNGTSLGTQGVAVTAQPYTLSFYGSGTVTLSGAKVATVAGSATSGAQTTYTFTPTAGTVTLTVAGTVQFAQLETGSSASSFVPTAGAAATRSAESIPAGTYITNASTAGDPAVYAPATAYTVGQQVQYNRIIYQCATNATGKQPDISPTFWSKVGPINQDAMFDTTVSTATTNADVLCVAINAGQAVDTLQLLKLTCNSVNVLLIDAADGTPYSSYQDLTLPIADWWEYIYTAPKSATKALCVDMPPYRTGVLTVAFDNTGGTAAVGLLTTGVATQSGTATTSSSDSISDYSIVQTDTFGNRNIVVRDYSDDCDVMINVTPDASPVFREFLAAQRAQPTAVILDESRPDAQYFGLPSFKRTFSFPEYDVYNLTMKGFT